VSGIALGAGFFTGADCDAVAGVLGNGTEAAKLAGAVGAGVALLGDGGASGGRTFAPTATVRFAVGGGSGCCVGSAGMDNQNVRDQTTFQLSGA
jgi:hypothetical protein